MVTWEIVQVVDGGVLVLLGLWLVIGTARAWKVHWADVINWPFDNTPRAGIIFGWLFIWGGLYLVIEQIIKAFPPKDSVIGASLYMPGLLSGFLAVATLGYLYLWGVSCLEQRIKKGKEEDEQLVS